MKVLVIDDDVNVLDFLKTFFDHLNHETVTTASPIEGLKKLVTEEPDLVLLDIMMPEKDGLTVLKEIKEIDTQVTVVMITAYKNILAPTIRKNKSPAHFLILTVDDDVP